jgi:hypothetical protein
MLFNVPQFIEIEDKIVGPFTAKQLGWMGAGGVILLVLWNLLDTSAFIISAIIVCAVFGALAFYRPYGQPLIRFILSSVHFTFRPQVYVWKRNYDNIGSMSKTKNKISKEKVFQKKALDNQKLKEISKILDQKY